MVQPKPPAAVKPPVKAPLKSKRERWLELAPKRTQNVLTSIRRLQNCSNSASYEWTDDEIGAIIDAISGTMESLAESFSPKVGKGASFSFLGSES